MFAQVMDSNVVSTVMAPIWPWPGSHFSWMTFGIEVTVLLVLSPWLLGMVLIDEQEVGVVVKKFGFAKLPPGQLIALERRGGFPGGHARAGTSFRLLVFPVPGDENGP